LMFAGANKGEPKDDDSTNNEIELS
jgi:hypothetical protein